MLRRTLSRGPRPASVFRSFYRASPRHSMLEPRHFGRCGDFSEYKEADCRSTRSERLYEPIASGLYPPSCKASRLARTKCPGLHFQALAKNGRLHIKQGKTASESPDLFI